MARERSEPHGRIEHLLTRIETIERRIEARDGSSRKGLLAQSAPTFGRPTVDALASSGIGSLKELRFGACAGGGV